MKYRRTVLPAIVVSLAVLAAQGCSSDPESSSSSSSSSSSGGSSSSGSSSGGSSSSSSSSSGGSSSSSSSSTSSGGTDGGTDSGTGKALLETCTSDGECASNACFSGGQGAYCSRKCTAANAAQVCVDPGFDGTCNNKGYCKKS